VLRNFEAIIKSMIERAAVMLFHSFTYDVDASYNSYSHAYLHSEKLGGSAPCVKCQLCKYECTAGHDTKEKHL